MYTIPKPRLQIPKGPPPQPGRFDVSNPPYTTAGTCSLAPRYRSESIMNLEMYHGIDTQAELAKLGKRNDDNYCGEFDSTYSVPL